MTRFFALLLALAGMGLVDPAQSQDYPSRPIRLVIGYAAGGGADTIARFFADKLSALAGKQVLVENKPGATGAIAHVYVAKSKPDGYTIYMVGLSSLAATPFFYKSPPVDALKDYSTIIAPLSQTWVLLVDANKPWKTLAEFTEHLKGRGSNGSYATATQMGMVMSELYKSHLGLQTVPVNYKAVADSVNDLLSGQLDMIAGDPAFALGLVKGGKARALATTGATRSGAFPTVPTMTESGVPMDLVSYWGMIAPAGTPDAIIERLNGWFVQILKTEEARKFFNDVAPSDILFTTKEQAREILERDAKLWAEYVKVAKIEPN